MIFWLRIIASLTPRWVVRRGINRWSLKLIARARRTPYFPLPGYMNRWWLFKDKFGWSGRIHETLRSDADRHLHDHPWDNVSIILEGCYWEIMPRRGNYFHPRAVLRAPGDIVVRYAEDAHRLITVGPVTSLFLTTPKRRRWGFHTEKGWVYWKRYVDPVTLGPEELREINDEPAAVSARTL